MCHPGLCPELMGKNNIVKDIAGIFCKIVIWIIDSSNVPMVIYKYILKKYM